jgi:hypothetical protein
VVDGPSLTVSNRVALKGSFSCFCEISKSINIQPGKNYTHANFNNWRASFLFYEFTNIDKTALVI